MLSERTKRFSLFKIECYSYATVVGLIQLMRLTINVTLAKDRAVIAKINESPVSQFIFNID